MFLVVHRLMPPVILTAVVLCFVVTALFRQPYVDHPAWRAFGFETCDLPCWAGIVPGETLFADAFDLLVEQVPNLTMRVLIGGTQISFTAASPEQVAAGTLFGQQQRVSSVQLNLQMPLDQLVSRLGTPDCFLYTLDAFSPGGSLIVYWESERTVISALVHLQNARMRLTSPIQALALSAESPHCDEEGKVGWIGFAARWRYQRLQRQTLLP